MFLDKIIQGTYIQAHEHDQRLDRQELPGGRVEVKLFRKKSGQCVAMAVLSETFVKYDDHQGNKIHRAVILAEYGSVPGMTGGFSDTSLCASSADLYAILAVVASGIAPVNPDFRLPTNDPNEGKFTERGKDVVLDIAEKTGDLPEGKLEQ